MDKNIQKELDKLADDIERKAISSSNPQDVKKTTDMIRNLLGASGGSNYTPPKKKRKKR